MLYPCVPRAKNDLVPPPVLSWNGVGRWYTVKLQAADSATRPLNSHKELICIYRCPGFTASPSPSPSSHRPPS